MFSIISMKFYIPPCTYDTKAYFPLLLLPLPLLVFASGGCYGCGEREIKFLTIRTIPATAPCTDLDRGWSAQIRPHRALKNRTTAEPTADVSHRSRPLIRRRSVGEQIALVVPTSADKRKVCRFWFPM